MTTKNVHRQMTL